MAIETHETLTGSTSCKILSASALVFTLACSIFSIACVYAENLKRKLVNQSEAVCVRVDDARPMTHIRIDGTYSCEIFPAAGDISTLINDLSGSLISSSSANAIATFPPLRTRLNLSVCAMGRLRLHAMSQKIDPTGKLLRLEEASEIRSHRLISMWLSVRGATMIPEILVVHLVLRHRKARDSFTNVYTGIPSRRAKVLASDRQFCFEPLYLKNQIH